LEEQTLLSKKTFEELGVCSEICEAVKAMGYLCPTKIQAESLPYTLKSRDMIGLAETGSGKTAAFAIPVI
jgi:superfamily II DNA/RNA helicase